MHTSTAYCAVTVRTFVATVCIEVWYDIIYTVSMYDTTVALLHMYDISLNVCFTSFRSSCAMQLGQIRRRKKYKTALPCTPENEPPTHREDAEAPRRDVFSYQTSLGESIYRACTLTIAAVTLVPMPWASLETTLMKYTAFFLRYVVFSSEKKKQRSFWKDPVDARRAQGNRGGDYALYSLLLYCTLPFVIAPDMICSLNFLL